MGLGGQAFLVDEARFVNGHYLLSSLSSGTIYESIDLILSTPAHTGFILFSALAEGLRFLCLLIITLGSVEAYELTLNPQLGIKFASFFLALPSVVNIAMVYAIVRRLKGGEQEALLAAFFMVASNSMFYFSRHLVPYDCSIMLSLFALWVGINPKNKLWSSFFCGFLSSLALLTYNGYWILSFVVCGIQILVQGRNFRGIIIVLICTALGGFTPFLILQLTSLFINRNFISDILSWAEATSANQMGDFGIGWRVFFQYLWETEHGLVLVWIAGICISLTFIVKGKQKKISSSSKIGLCGVFSIYLLLILGSDFLEKFVVYGRTARMAVPFLCIAASFPVLKILNGIKSSQKSLIPIFPIAFVCICVQTTANFSSPLIIKFPGEVLKNVREEYGEVSLSSTYQGVNISFFDHKNPDSQYTLSNANKLIPPLNGVKSLPEGNKILNFQHPYNYKPYQFIHFKEEERKILRSSELLITLVQSSKK